MSETSISLLSIVLGIVGSVTWFFFKRKRTSVFGLTGCILIGVFSSVFAIKSIGRLGFDPVSIMNKDELNSQLLLANLFLSLFSGVLGVYVLDKLYLKFIK